MTTDVAKLKLREAQENLRQAEIILEMHENGIREMKEDIKELEAIINKKDDWRLVEVPDRWQELYEEKALLMADMMHFAYARNEGWVPDLADEEAKWGLVREFGYVISDYTFYHNEFVFGVSVKSEEIAQEMLEEFGERIEEIYNKQY